MSNSIKYSTGSETLALKKGNFYIGIGDVGKGPTDVTGYYNGITPPNGGYTIYINKESNGPSIYTCSDDIELIKVTNLISGQSYSGVQECFNYYYSQNDKMLVNQDYPSNFPYIPLDGLTSYFDAKLNDSYSGSGDIWYNINGLGPKNNVSLINTPTYSTNYEGVFLLDGTNDYFTLSGVTTGNTWSVFIWFFYDGQTNMGNRGHRTFFATDTFRYQWDDRPNQPNVGYGPFLNFNIASGGYTNYWAGLSDNLSPSDIFNQWHYVGFTSDGTTLKNYFDGVQRGNNITVTRQFSFSGNLRIAYDGISGIGSIDWFYENGGDNYIGPFSIYNRALTADEVLQNYNVQKNRFNL